MLVRENPLTRKDESAFRNVVRYKAMAFTSERMEASVIYEVKRARAVWDTALRRFRCPVGVTGGGQMTNRMGTNCGTGVVRRALRGVINAGERIDAGMSERGRRRRERGPGKVRRAAAEAADRAADVIDVTNRAQVEARRQDRKRKRRGKLADRVDRAADVLDVTKRRANEARRAVRSQRARQVVRQATPEARETVDAGTVQVRRRTARNVAALRGTLRDGQKMRMRRAARDEFERLRDEWVNRLGSGNINVDDMDLYIANHEKRNPAFVNHLKAIRDDYLELRRVVNSNDDNEMVDAYRRLSANRRKRLLAVAEMNLSQREEEIVPELPEVIPLSSRPGANTERELDRAAGDFAKWLADVKVIIDDAEDKDQLVELHRTFRKREEEAQNLRAAIAAQLEDAPDAPARRAIRARLMETELELDARRQAVNMVEARLVNLPDGGGALSDRKERALRPLSPEDAAAVIELDPREVEPFEFNGVEIVDATVDESGINSVDPIAYYGSAYVNQALSTIRDMRLKEKKPKSESHYRPPTPNDGADRPVSQKIRTLDDAVKHLHQENGHIDDIPDEIVIDALFGDGVLDEDGNHHTAEEILAGGLAGEPETEMLENDRFQFVGIKGGEGDFQVWEVWEVRDKSTGEVRYLKASTFGAQDHVNELLGADLVGLVGFDSDPSGTAIRVGPLRPSEWDGIGDFRWMLVRHVDEYQSIPRGRAAYQGGYGAISVQPRASGGFDAVWDPQTSPEDIAKMVVLDYLTGNTDRHTGNFLVAQDGARKRLVPFDHGLIFGGRAKEDHAGVPNMSLTDMIYDTLQEESGDTPAEYADKAFNNVMFVKLRSEGQRAAVLAEVERLTKLIAERGDYNDIFDANRIARRGMQLSQAEKDHIEMARAFFKKRLEVLQDVGMEDAITTL